MKKSFRDLPAPQQRAICGDKFAGEDFELSAAGDTTAPNTDDEKVEDIEVSEKKVFYTCKAPNKIQIDPLLSMDEHFR